ncbi:MAG TPA: xanthine dehydrogenase family protein subunit M [Thermoanaerobaculia bacterium]|nr:xanthine dehydrogenase family protein subunit M [Thermoanaerobaculia bacterium]
MQAFEYARPATVEQAVRLLASGGSVALAGGSDLLALMKDGVEAPHRVVALGGIAALRGLRSDGAGGAGLRIGALVTLDELANDPEVRRRFPVVAQAAGHAAGPQIRNFGTVAGNLCQRPRCWYFRTGHGLLAQRDGKSLVVEGDNRYHAVLGNAGPAYFVHPSTLSPLLIALGARLSLAGPGGERQVELASFYRTPRTAAEREHALAPGELVTAVLVPPLGGRLTHSYEVRQRQTLDWSLATAAVALSMQGGKVASARVVLGQVAPVPWRAQAAEELLRGKAVDAEVAAQAGEAAVRGARALSGNRYKIQLARVAVRRALLAAAGRKEA